MSTKGKGVAYFWSLVDKLGGRGMSPQDGFLEM